MVNLTSSMKKIILKPAKHRHKHVVAIEFSYDDEIKNHLKISL
ncbi:MAG: hypothetical protein WAO74_09170 [Polaribacter sp.]